MRKFSSIRGLFAGKANRKAALSRAASRTGTPAFESLEERRLFSGFSDAISLGTLEGSNPQGGTVPAGGSTVTYSLNMETSGTLYFRLRAYDHNADLRLYNGAASPVLLTYGTAFSNDESSGNFSKQLPAGKYYLQVASDGPATSYLMRPTADYAGETLATARNVGNLQPGITSFSDEVGTFKIDPLHSEDSYNDPLDIYKFSLTSSSTVSANVSNAPTFSEPFFQTHMVLAKDNNHDGVIEASEIIASSGAGVSENIYGRVLTAGTYYILVDPAGSTYPNYTLSINSDLISDTATNAKNVGTIYGQQQFNEAVTDTDGNDYYKFTLEAPATFTASLSGLSTEAGIQINNSANHQVIYSNPSGSGDRSVTTSLPAGTYYAIAYYTGTTFGTNYNLQLTADYAGNGFGVPRVLGTLGATNKLVQDYIGGSDVYDYYKFNIASNNQPFEASVGDSYTDGFFPNMNPTIYLARLTGGIYTPVATVNTPGQGNILLQTLNAGTYELIVASGNGQAGNYTMALYAPPDLAGNDLPVAKNLGTLAGSSSFNDFVSNIDTVDTFKFNMATAGTFNSKLYTGVSSVYLQLVKDMNNNGVIDSGDVIAGSFNTGNGATQSISKSLSAGNYFIRVRYNSGPALTYYELTLDANYAGTTLNTAHDLGTAGTTAVKFSDEVNETSNPVDYYKITLASAATLSANLAYVSGENTVLELIQDKNHNGVVDAGDVLVTTANSGNGIAAITKALAAGTYFFQVHNLLGGTNYSLSVHR